MKNENIWFKRVFELDQPVFMFPMICERLRGGPARLEEKVRGLSKDVLTYSEGESWSIMQQIGHLVLVEGLWLKRMADYKNNAKTLFAADLKNTKTKSIDFNQADLNELLKEFRSQREKFIELLDTVPENEVEKTAFHPRLEKPMRIIDHAYFAAEHDDHHLAKMTDLARG
ncbi:MAG: DinB family protein [Candidatus Zixiibacteriota bacterium]